MKFYESGKKDQVMPSGVSERQLPRTKFQPKAAPQARAVVPPAQKMAQTQAIIQALRQKQR